MLKLVMIARDEERCIGRALASAAPFVDQLVVVDTGSVDDTVRIARSHGAMVERHAWRDDFAAARNYALELADADWSLVLDADEWVRSGGERLARFRTTEPDHYGLVTIESVFEDGGRTHIGVEADARVIPRGVRYAGRVHERLTTVLPIRRCELVLGHDGYEPQASAAKRGRNERLLRKALASADADPYLHYQLGKDLELQGRYAESCASYEAARALSGDGRWRHDLLVRSLFVLKMLQRHREALELADREGERWAMSPDVAFALGDVYLDLAVAEPDQAHRHIARAEQFWRQCLDFGDRPGLFGSVSGRGSDLAAHNLAVLYEQQGDVARAQATRELERLFLASHAQPDAL